MCAPRGGGTRQARPRGAGGAPRGSLPCPRATLPTRLQHVGERALAHSLLPKLGAEPGKMGSPCQQRCAMRGPDPGCSPRGQGALARHCPRTHIPSDGPWARTRSSPKSSSRCASHPRSRQPRGCTEQPQPWPHAARGQAAAWLALNKIMIIKKIKNQKEKKQWNNTLCFVWLICFATSEIDTHESAPIIASADESGLFN